MAETAASTAYGPMVIAASERSLPQEQRIIDDPLAYKMLPAYMKLMVKAVSPKSIRRAFINMLEKVTPGIFTGILCRKRYIEDKVLETLKTNIDALVILGAGLDTLAYRIPQLASIRVYEVDLPENLSYKKKKLEELFGAVPSHVTLAPTDFEDRQLEDTLELAGYSFKQRSLYVWEGVTQYLTEAAVRDTFQFLAKAKPGSRLVFTYVLKDFIEGRNMYSSERMYQRFRGKNPVWLFGLDPREVDDFISDYSWKVLEHIGADELVVRYVKPAGRTEPISVLERFVFAQKQ